MEELQAIARKVPLVETLLVVDAMIGQEALHIAEGFRDTIKITGLIFTKIDGDARGGAAISVRSVTGVPIKFLGTGEGIDAIEVFDPVRLASRILGMGDMIGLIEKAEAAFDEKTQKEQQNASRGQFTLEDIAISQAVAEDGIDRRYSHASGGWSGSAEHIPEDTEEAYAAEASHSMTARRPQPRSSQCVPGRRIAGDQEQTCKK